MNVSTSSLLTIVKQWLPDGAPNTSDKLRRVPGELPVELTATVRIRPDHENERVEASMSGELVIDGPPARFLLEAGEDGSSGRARQGLEARIVAPARERIEPRQVSSGRLARAEPLEWIQVIDDRGASLTSESFLGQGVDVEFRVQTRIMVAVTTETGVPASDFAVPSHRGRIVLRSHLLRGIHARLLLRTYRGRSGPRFYAESILLPLLPAGHRIEFPYQRAPATIRSESWTWDESGCALEA